MGTGFFRKTKDGSITALFWSNFLISNPRLDTFSRNTWKDGFRKVLGFPNDPINKRKLERKEAVEAKHPQVSLVGAGPGDVELITVRGLQRLKAAEVVIYDDLSGEGLLEFCLPDAELIYVGKRAGAHCAAQEAINALLVAKARAGKRIVRLKGGDPFIFGRGGEEVLALAQAGIACEVVPGVTAAASAGAASLVPLTHRKLSSGVLFVTGHECEKKSAELAWERLGALGVTLCVYMGAKNLPSIAGRLIAGGLLPDTPLVVVSRASLPGQSVHLATTREAAEGILEDKIETPALVIIGEVARVRTEVDELLDVARNQMSCQAT
jgi:uroporphyrin-III C-methyltransferase